MISVFAPSEIETGTIPVYAPSWQLIAVCVVVLFVFVTARMRRRR